jgi:hypothetical protein
MSEVKARTLVRIGETHCAIRWVKNTGRRLSLRLELGHELPTLHEPYETRQVYEIAKTLDPLAIGICVLPHPAGSPMLWLFRDGYDFEILPEDCVFTVRDLSCKVAKN